MEPVSDADQTCRSFHLAVSPLTDVNHYQDGFGNRVHHCNVLAAHTQVRVLAASVVDTHPRYRDLSSSVVVYPLVLDGAGLDTLDCLLFRGPVCRTPLLAPLLEALQPPPGIKVGQVVSDVAHQIHSRFTYAPAVTQASSPVDDVLRQGKGVCQDFAHLMIAVLRSFGVPARYVSGYIHRPNKESQSHAWCEAWLPDLGWLGIDPTNDRLADEQMVKVAIGRDFTDVPPNKGVYRGAAQEKMFVRVETRALERSPSLAWREQLPPLDGPLTALPIRVRGGVKGNDGPEQEQQ
jgi:transglutaminase-like putative cysteine protease